MGNKTEVITIRVTESIRGLLEKLAHREVRSLSQQCEWLILQQLKAKGLVDEDFRVSDKSKK
jgi:hypothetical protein